MIHIYSSGEGYRDINNLEGHSSSIIAVKFAFDPEETDEAKRLKLLSCGADKTIIYRSVQDPSNMNIYHKEVLKNNKMVSMEVQGNKVVAGLDKLVTVTHIPTFEKIYEKKPEKIKSTGSQDFHKVLLDRSETFLISASTDKFFTIQDTLSGTLVTKGTCGEQTTAIKLSLDNKYLITTSSEGCIYFWRLNDQITRSMNQRLKELNIHVSTLANRIEPILRMPEPVQKKGPIKSLKTISQKQAPEGEGDTAPSKVLFSGKSPGEILFQKNQQKLQGLNQRQVQQVEESREVVDMTKSQIKREDAKNMMNEINDVVGEIDYLFSTSNQKIMEEAKAARSPRFNDIKYRKAEEDLDLAVATGQIPDWAVTKGGTTLINQKDLVEKDTDAHHEIDLENAESSITLQPPAKNNFMVEKSETKDKDTAADYLATSEDDGEYDQDIDENQYQSLKATLHDNQVRNSLIYDDDFDTDEPKQRTGKFFNEETKNIVEDFDNQEIEEPQEYNQSWKSPEAMRKEFEGEESKNSQKQESQFLSLKDRRNQEKLTKQEGNQEQPTKHPLEDSQDLSSVEIESILMKDKGNELNGSSRRNREWNKNTRKAYNQRTGTHMEKDSNPINYDEFTDEIEEGMISQEDLPQNMARGFENIAQTPKPNTRFPVPSRDNMFGEASFGNQSRQYKNMREKTSETDVKPPIASPQKPDEIPQNLSKPSISQDKLSPNKANLSPPSNLGSDSKLGLKSKIPSIKKAGSKERRMIGDRKQIRSFVEEHGDQLEEVPIPHSQEEDKSVGGAQLLGPSNLNPQKEESLSIKNNYNLSTQPHIKSDTNSGMNEEFSQKEDSVHIDEVGRYETKSESYNYPHVESVGDTHLHNLANESILGTHADPVTTAAVNASINNELEKINASLIKLTSLSNRSDSKGVRIMPEVSENLNKSFNLWLSLMVNLKANSGNQFEANIKF